MTARTLVLALAARLACPGSAQAAPRKPAPVETKSPAAIEAMDLFEKSAALYRAGKLDEAIALLERAYSLQPAPVLLYNLGRAYEGKGDLERALTAYGAYLTGDPGTPDRLSIQVRMKTLEKTLDDRNRLEEEQRRLEGERRAAVLRAEQEVAKRRAVERARKITPAPWTIAAIGVAGLLAGTGLSVAAVHDRNEAIALGRAGGTQADAVSKLDDGRKLALGANISFGIGGALALGGTIWGIVDALQVRRIHMHAAIVPEHAPR